MPWNLASITSDQSTTAVWKYAFWLICSKRFKLFIYLFFNKGIIHPYIYNVELFSLTIVYLFIREMWKFIFLYKCKRYLFKKYFFVYTLKVNGVQTLRFSVWTVWKYRCQNFLNICKKYIFFCVQVFSPPALSKENVKREQNKHSITGALYLLSCGWKKSWNMESLRL